MMTVVMLSIACAVHADTITLPAQLEEIGEEAFFQAGVPEEIIIPEKVRMVGPRAFAYSSLKYVFIPDGVTSISPDSFEGTGVTVCSSEEAYARQFAADNGLRWIRWSEVPITEENFPDPAFRGFIARKDINHDSVLDSIETADITTLYCSNIGIVSLKGIENFNNLNILDCNYNHLTELDLSGLVHLRTLNCKYNQLGTLKFSSCTALSSLDCSANQLTALDLSGCSSLSSIDCSANQLTALGLSGCTAMSSLNCSNNQLTALDFSDSTALSSLNCSANQLTALDFSGCTALSSLNCGTNQLTALDLSENKKLSLLDCSSNQLSGLDLSQNTSLTNLKCRSNQLFRLDLSRNTKLAELICSSNPLAMLMLGRNTALTKLNCVATNIAELDLSGTSALKWLDCSYCKLSTLNIAKCRELVYLFKNRPMTYDIGTVYYGTSSSNTYLKYDSKVKIICVSAPVFTSTPRSTMASVGARVTFEAAASGTDVDFFWQYRTSPDEEWQHLSANGFMSTGRSSVYFTADASMDGYQYRCRASNEGGEVFSDYAELSVLVPTTITSQPADVIAEVGQTAAFSVSADGSYLNYQWQVCSPGSDSWTDLTDGWQATLSVSASRENNDCQYRCRVYNRISSEYSEPATLTVTSILIQAQPTDQVVGFQEDAMLSVTASGPDLHYQWERLSGETWQEIADADDAVLSLPWGELSGKDYYRCRVYNDLDTMITNSAKLLVGIAIDEAHFPNKTFRTFVANNYDNTNYDPDGRGVLSNLELNAVNSMDCRNMGISSLRGIEYFTSLQYLYCDSNYLTSLDLSANEQLVYLNCSNNHLTSLNIAECQELKTLNCFQNQLKTLDVSPFQSLESLYCSNNKLESLDILNNPQLGSLDCHQNQIKRLDLNSILYRLVRTKAPNSGSWYTWDDGTYQLICDGIVKLYAPAD